jgi:hypothetical protein
MANASSHNIPHTNVFNAHTKLEANVFVCQVCQVSSHMRKVNKFVGLAYYQGKDIVFRFNIEYSSLRDFGP